MSRLLEDGDIYFLGGGVLVGALFTLGYQMIFSPKATKMTAKEKTSPEKTEPVAESPKILAINMSLKMKPGKVAAQAGHASLGAYRTAQKEAPKELKKWMEGDQVKITLRVPDLEEMKQIIEKCKKAGIVTHCVADAGKTQIPKGSRTVLAIGPAPISQIDPITRHLKLYT